MKFTTAAALALSGALALAACSSPAPPAAAGGGGGAPSSTSPADLNIAYVPYTGNAPMFLGIKRNTYSDAGLTLKMTPVQAPAAAIAGLVNGQNQLAFTTVVTLVTAVSQGTDIKCVTAVDGLVSSAADERSTATIVKGDSPYQSEKDLAGKKVGVVALGSQNHLFTLEEATLAGIDPASVQVVQIPFPQMQAALDQGRLDAVVATAPFTAQIQAAGGRVINWPEAELNDGGNGTCLAATGTYISQHPDVIAAFTKAHTAALAYAKDHTDEAKATIPSFLDVKPADAAKTVAGVTYDAKINTASVDKFQQLMLKHGFIKAAVPLDKLVYTPAS
jgi:NitT/TauT family transport system substrate-binding protein